jgi:hypothetical protein
MSVSQEIISELRKLKVKGLFFVRQKRIPTILGQGLSVGVDGSSYVPMLKKGENKDGDSIYISEGFINKDKMLAIDFESRLLESKSKQSSGFLCLDACVSPRLQSMLDGSDYVYQKLYHDGTLDTVKTRHFNINFKNKTLAQSALYKAQSIFVNSDVPAKIVNDYSFCTRAGAEEDIKNFGFFGGRNYDKDSNQLIRGVYCPFIGTSETLEDNSIYNIRVKGYSIGYMQEYVKIRGNDQSPFYAISDR